MLRNNRIGILLVCLALGSLTWPTAVHAQRRGAGRARGGVVFVGGYFYDPFFGPYPWWAAGAYPYPYLPVYDARAHARLLVTPKDAAVYVDGYYAGVVDDFDGFFQNLPLSPGGHEIVLALEGFQTVHQTLYLRPDSTYKLRYTMQPLAPGQVSEPPPAAPPVPPPPPGSAITPRTPRRGAGEAIPPPQAPPFPTPPSRPPTRQSGYGSLVIRVQPADAEVRIDGERWMVSGDTERLVVQVAAGRHRIEVQKDGYRRFSTEVQVGPGETAPLNVSLSAEGQR